LKGVKKEMKNDRRSKPIVTIEKLQEHLQKKTSPPYPTIKELASSFDVTKKQVRKCLVGLASSWCIDESDGTPRVIPVGANVNLVVPEVAPETDPVPEEEKTPA